MRLVCPNCEAKYEVPDDAIPDTGRDVQCANCGHAWFQMRHKSEGAAPEAVSEPAPEPVAVTETVVDAVAEPAEQAGSDPVVAEGAADEAVTEAAFDTPDAEPTLAAQPATDDRAEHTSDPDAVVEGIAARTAEDEEDAEDDAPISPAPYAVDDSVLAILREEAERESEARKAEIRTLESQPDLGIDAAVAPPPPVAVLNVDDAGGKPSARRDLLPDVEEINSTLRPSEHPVEDETDDDGPTDVARNSSGFRSGFLMVMTLAILAMALYVSAPTLSSAIPAIAEPLSSYVAFVDGMRLQLDGLMKSATVAINGGG